MKKILGLIAAMAMGAYAQYGAWSNTYQVTVNTLAGGVTGAVTNYPLLVKITDPAIIAQSEVTGGGDIRFSSFDETVEYAYEIEYWSADTAVVWVLVPSIAASTDGQKFKMHIGNDAASSESDGSAVFAPANGWVAVWHMNQAITSGTDNALDATGNDLNAAPGLAGLTYPFPQVNSAIGHGYNLGGTSNTVGRYFEVPDGDSLLNLNTSTGPFTLSAWVNTVTGTRSAIISKYWNGVDQGRQFALQTAGGGNNWTMVVNPTSQYNLGGDNEFLASGAHTAAWQQVTGVFQGPFPTFDAAGAEATINLYLNGTAATSWGRFNQPTTQIGTLAPFRIGAIVDGGGATTQRLLRGAIDEVRVSNVARSAAWAKLDYETQHPGDVSAVVSVGEVVNVMPSSKDAMIISAVSTRVSGNAVTFVVADNAVGTLSIVDVHGRTLFSREVTLRGNREISWIGGKGMYVARFASKNGMRFADHKFTVVR